ncbi:MAG: phage holin family protein [Oscillospiraceae bacterium]|jgi:uncharacterized membrane protein YvlD (DUF360 family)|nr:phage holin family protein [Oscillospiraceae bacterium]
MKRIIFKALGTVAAIVLLSYFLPGFHCESLVAAIEAGVVLALVYLVLRPIARILVGVFNWLTLGLIGIIVDAGILTFAVSKIPGCYVEDFMTALIAALVVNTVRMCFGFAAKKAKR